LRNVAFVALQPLQHVRPHTGLANPRVAASSATALPCPRIDARLAPVSTMPPPTNPAADGQPGAPGAPHLSRRQRWQRMSPVERVFAYGRYVDRLPLKAAADVMKRALANVVRMGLEEGIDNVMRRYGITRERIMDAIKSGKSISEARDVMHNAEESCLALMAVGWRAHMVAELLRVAERTVRTAKIRQRWSPASPGDEAIAPEHMADGDTIAQRIGLDGGKGDPILGKRARHPLAKLYILRGFSASGLSVAISAPVSVVLSWAKGQRPPKPHYKARLCSVLRVTPEFLDRVLRFTQETPTVAARRKRILDRAKRNYHRGKQATPGPAAVAPASRP
jgi:hypothetical protein